jgi:hypothetical protein
VGYTFTDLAGLRVPDENAADDVPADLSYLVEQLDTAIVLQAISTADRDSKFYDAPSGVICVVRAALPDGTISGVYIKTANAGASTWGTLWEPPASLSFTAIQLASDYTTRGTPTYDPGVYNETGGIFATLTGAFARVDGTQVTGSNVIGYLPSGFLPLKSAEDHPVAITSSAANTTSCPKISLASDGTISYFGTATNWVGLEGVRYFLAPS